MMVILRRKAESIVFDGDTVITILGIRGKRVRVKVVKPKGCRIHRQMTHVAVSHATPSSRVVTLIITKAQRRRCGSLSAPVIFLNLKKGESLVINDIATVSVVEIRRASCRLATVAPKGFSVHRQEVHEAIYGTASEQDHISR